MPTSDPGTIYMTCLYCQINQHEECMVRSKSMVPGKVVVCDCPNEHHLEKRKQEP